MEANDDLSAGSVGNGIDYFMRLRWWIPFGYAAGESEMLLAEWSRLSAGFSFDLLAWDDACFYGLTQPLVELASALLNQVGHLRAGFFDVTHDMETYLDTLRQNYVGRALYATDFEEFGIDKFKCDLVIIGRGSRYFSIDRVRPLLRSEASTFALVLEGCSQPVDRTTSAVCDFLSNFWYKTSLIQGGKCLSQLCMSRTPVDLLVDPNSYLLDCDAYSLGPGEGNATMPGVVGEFGQDWFLHTNFLRGQRHGVYVDVGAYHPFRSRRAAAGRAQLLAKKGGIWAHAASAGTGTDP